MGISLSPETERLIEEQMKQAGFGTADELVRFALRSLEQTRGVDYDDLDPETRAAIEEGEAQYERGEVRSLDEVAEELKARFIRK